MKTFFIAFALLFYSCNTFNKSEGKEENKIENQITLSNNEFFSSLDYNPKKVVFISLSKEIELKKVKVVIDLYYEHYDEWLDVNFNYDKSKESKENWIFKQVQIMSSKTGLSLKQVSQILKDYTFECNENY
jgi:hypothetical protein|tara:strand:- start:141 stop:533 length:393 start_codon:yes stop_codon:yes gene_type:complete